MGVSLSLATGVLTLCVTLLATGAMAKPEFEYIHQRERRLRLLHSVRAVRAAAESRQCPHSAADLEVTGNLDVMLTARASINRDVVIIIPGPTSGSSSIRMGALATRMALNMLANLEELGIRNTLALTSHLHKPGHVDTRATSVANNFFICVI